ncbi:MAG: hypothetical protein MZV64_69485 [Ignavibacteriales bacterium]|nr:hypothetical protein [Ignavibacteriales bacterium]
MDRPDQVFMLESMSGTMVFYGNEFYAPNHVSYMNNIIDKNNPYPKIYYVINNVIYGGPASANLFAVDSDSGYFYNNIVQHNVSVGSSGTRFVYPYNSFLGNWNWIDGNLYE